MAFQVVERVGSQPENIQVKVLHQDHPLTAIIRGAKIDDIRVGKFIQAEIGYDEVLEWIVLEDFNDERSGIWQEQDGIHLAGRIHNVLDYGDGKTFIDIYMQNGSEFFTVSSDAMEDIALDSNTGLEIVVKTLHLHLTS